MSLASMIKSAVPIAVLAFLVLGIASKPAAASTATANIAVSATVNANCIISANPLAFGTYTGAQNQATTTLSVTCTNTTPYNVGFSAGLGTGATVTTRKMTGPSSAVLSYGLYSDSGRSVNWGSTVGTDTVTGTGNGSAQAITVYGALPASQYVNPGAYSDTITASIIF